MLHAFIFNKKRNQKMHFFLFNKFVVPSLKKKKNTKKSESLKIENYVRIHLYIAIEICKHIDTIFMHVVTDE